MLRFHRLTTTSCLALVLGAQTAFADLSANDVWSDWKDYIGSFGYAISGLERDTGQGLAVSNVIVNMPLPEDDGSMKMAIGTLDFVEQNDGSVRIELGEEISFSFDVDPKGGEAVSGQMIFAQSDAQLIASGTPEDMTYTYSAAQADMRMDGLTVDGVAFGSDVFGLSMRFEGMNSVTNVKRAALRSYDQTMSLDKISYTFNFNDPEGNDGKMDMRGSASGLSFAGKGDIPEMSASPNASAMIAAGFGFEGAYDFAGGETQVTFEAPDGNGTMNSTSQGGTFAISMSKDGLGYETETRGLSLNALFSTLPIPVSIEAQRMALNVLLPTMKGPDAQDFGALVSLENFTMADMLWGMFDPQGQLPRDPATLTLDLSGKAKLLFDYLDPAQSAILEQTGAAPGELEALTLNTLLLELAGAKLSGTGAFTFDNSDTVTFDGMPRPQGALDLQLMGGNGLLDKLVAMGLLPQNQAMSARMMMGMFARPGQGEDALVSRIEVTNDGQVLANGQRLR